MDSVDLMEHGIREGDGGGHVIQMVGTDAAAAVDSVSDENEITALLLNKEVEKPKFNIFSVSYPKRKPLQKGPTSKESETEVIALYQFLSWTWSGSRYSGLLCMALSSSIYCIMQLFSDFFSVGSIPIFEIVFTRCAIILILSFVWLRRTGQPILGPPHIWKLIFARALIGFLSLLTFIYSIQSLPLSNAVVLNFTIPILASVVARIVLHEKLSLADIGGLACSFFGLLFIFRPMLVIQGGLTETGDPSKASIVRGHHPVYALLVGLFSAITGGFSYCLIRAAGKASDQPVVTVFGFGVLATPAAAVCTFAFEEFVLPNFYTFLPLVVLGVLAFFAEVFLARGLQLEKTSKVTNMQYIEALLSQIWGIAFLRVAPSFNRLIGCLLLLVSVCSTMYFGPEKEIS
ncbi:uncharacterized protein LOC131228587 isoform X2 [Magnolia sinica]|nr:uncharacterized protein LOC131228587 isoform X2 [Magnolia sinica]